MKPSAFFYVAAALSLVSMLAIVAATAPSYAEGLALKDGFMQSVASASQTVGSTRVQCDA